MNPLFFEVGDGRVINLAMVLWYRSDPETTPVDAPPGALSAPTPGPPTGRTVVKVFLQGADEHFVLEPDPGERFLELAESYFAGRPGA
jgi:hypothetical protein